MPRATTVPELPPGIFRILGFVAVGIALTFHESFNVQPVLDRWSYAYTGMLSAYWTALAVYVVLRSRRLGLWLRPRATRDRAAALNLDFAVSFWGAAYLIDTVRSPERAARLFEFHVFGATQPFAVILEWFGILLALVAAILWASSRLAPRGQNLFLLSATIGSMLVIGEGLVRTISVLNPAPQGFPTYRAQMWMARHVDLNSHGFRGPELNHGPRPPGVRRIVVIGDSFAFGVGINNPRKRVGELIAARLEEALREPWEHFNISLPDTHTLHHIGMLGYARPLEPDVVVLIYVFNDIEYLEPMVERTVLTEQPTRWLSRVHPARTLFRNSYGFQQIYVELRSIRYQVKPSDRRDPYLDQGLLERHMRDVSAFVSNAADIAPVVCILPFELGVDALPDAGQRYDRFVEAAFETGVPICDLKGAFDGVGLQDLRVNRWDAHPGEHAHSLAGEKAAHQIVGLLREDRRTSQTSSEDTCEREAHTSGLDIEGRAGPRRW